jgi:(5-formylfuran-3-yl)methyl phosphate synthase
LRPTTGRRDESVPGERNRPEEADVALAHGADLIDLKGPARGALGALAPDIVRAAVERIAGRRPVSAVAGDLPMEPEVVASAGTAMVETGVDYVKVACSPARNAPIAFVRWRRSRAGRSSSA